jgi:tRNA (cmo5U34)-methyltransferase
VTEKFTLEEIRDFWTMSADEHGESPKASWSDIRVIEMEIAEIGKRLSDGDRVLDAGCANGFSTVQFAAIKDVSIVGFDYIPAMIENARRQLAAVRDRLRGRVEFSVGNLLTSEMPAGPFDKVVATRVIINLGNWETQLRGLRACAKVLKPGGCLLLSEASLQGWRNLNAFRREWGLPDIPMPAFNNYLDEERLVRDLAPEMEIRETSSFSSTYYVGTRVLKPLLARATGANVNAADPLMEWNRWFASLPPAGDYGTQKLFVFRKRL